MSAKMDDSEENISSEDTGMSDSLQSVKPKAKKKSMIERELETNLTAKITSPVNPGDGASTSRYGRARRSKANEIYDYTNVESDLKSTDQSSFKNQSPVYKMHASNSPVRSESAKKVGETFLDTQIESIYQENISLSRFSNEEKLCSSSPKKYPKVYIRKDLIQNKEPEETITLIKNIFSPNKSGKKSSTHLNNVLERSSEKFNLKSSKSQKYIDNSSVVKTLDFDSKKKKENDTKTLSKSDLFEMEAQCMFQVGDLAWARMGTYPFWPCIITREPTQGVFVRKKLFGRVTRDIIHVTFFGDNGRRGWIVDSMLRKYLGQLEFETARENFTPEDKKKDPKLYTAYFVSEKKQAQWNKAVEESEVLYREPKRLRIDIFNEMLQQSRVIKPKNPKSGKISRTDSEVSLSESLYDSLFSEDDGKGDSKEHSKNRSKNKSLDVFEVVTACLDNMAARSGITKIQKQSHMDRWIQKAKSKTPEKLQTKPQIVKKRELKEGKVSSSKHKKVMPEAHTKKSHSLKRSIGESKTCHEQNDSINLCEDNSESGFDQTSTIDDIAQDKKKFKQEEIDETKVSNNNCVNSDHSQKNVDQDNIAFDQDIKIEKIDDGDNNCIADYEGENNQIEHSIKKENDFDTGSAEITTFKSENRRSLRSNRDKRPEFSVDNPEFLKYMEIRQDLLLDENPDLTYEEIVEYLYKTWLYEKAAESDGNNDVPESSRLESSTKKPSKPRDRSRQSSSRKKSSKSSKRSRNRSQKSIKIEATEIKDNALESNDTINSENGNSSMGVDISKTEHNETTLSSEDINCDSCLDSSQEYGLDNSEIISTNAIQVNDCSIDQEVLNETEGNNKLDEQPKIPELIKNNEETNTTEVIDSSTENTRLMLEPVDVEPKKNLDEESLNIKISTDANDAVCNESLSLQPQIEIKHNVDDDIKNNLPLISDVNKSNENNTGKDINDEPRDWQNKDENVTNAKEIDASDMSVYEDSDSDIVLPYSPLTDHEDLDDVGTKHFAKNTSKKKEPTTAECSPTFTEQESNLDKSSPDNSLVVQEEDSIKHTEDPHKEVEENKEVKENKVDNEKTIEHENNSVKEGKSRESKRSLSKLSIEIDNWVNNLPSKINSEINANFDKISKRDVTEVDISDNKEVHILNCTSENIKENGLFHTANHVNGDVTPKSEKKSRISKTQEYDTDWSRNYEMDIDSTSIDSEDSVSSTFSEKKHRLRLKRNKPRRTREMKSKFDVKEETLMVLASENKHKIRSKTDRSPKHNKIDIDTISINSEDSVSSTKSDNKRKLRSKRDNINDDPLENPEFVKYLEIRQDALMDENPELSQEEVVSYLHKTWLYEENKKTDEMKNNDLRESNLVKGLNKSPINKKKLSLNKNNLHKYLHTKEISKEQRKKRRTSSIDIGNGKNLDCDKKDMDVTSTIESPENNKDKKIVKVNMTDIIIKDAKLPIKEENQITLSTIDLSKVDDKEVDSSEVTRDLKTEENKVKDEFDKDSIDSEDSETPLIKCKLRAKARKRKALEEDTISINSEDSEISLNKPKKEKKKREVKETLSSMEDPEFIKYLELRQDVLIDEHPELTHDEIVSYLYKTWLYEESNKSELKKSDEKAQSTLVKGLAPTLEPKKIRRPKVKTEKDNDETVSPKDKPKRHVIPAYYNEEEFSDIEEELEVFEIFRKKYKPSKEVTPKTEKDQDQQIGSLDQSQPTLDEEEIIEVYDEVELYFQDLTKPKPNIFKGLLREKVCEICEKTDRLVKCKCCNGMFHANCIKNELVEKEDAPAPSRGRKKKKKIGRKPKNLDDSDNFDDKSQDVSEDNDVSFEDTESHVVDADAFEAELAIKMKEILEKSEVIEYEVPTSEDELLWNDIAPGKCEIIDVKLKPVQAYNIDTDFKCNNCQKYNVPICFVCKSAVSKQESSSRQKCQVAHCHKFYHLECLDHWPQTQFNSGEPSRNNKKISEHFEALSCPRHVCHTCVSDDPRGCKTRFSGDKLARCVRCPATYHSFTKCLPAGSQILSASQIVCPRHTEHRPGKVPCHVNTGWCFICALGGSLICCEYCPTSFHAECLNIKPPEGNYMCEDCETGRLPLYGEMVWVKLGHYRWWPGIILHPSEIPDNILAVKHSPGEFVVRFFGQYDHYWVNRGRVFPFQEGDSGRISSQKSKIDAAFTTAMEHAYKACEILKSAQPNEEESLDIASSLLPPHYVKLKVNKPCGSLCGRRLEDPESSLTQCECNPLDEDPCGPYSHCLNRMLLTECGPTCRAGDRCNNRAFEKRLYPKLVPYRTPSRGWGLKTLVDIKAGQFVIEYVGELIDEEEFRRRMRRKHEIRDENYYFLTLDKDRMIDAGPKGNLARFMNHCCEPNCETQKWTVLGDVRVGLFAINDIPANSEVTFNYNLECAGIEKKRCMCGAKRCSGYIGAKPKQDEPQSKKNKLQNKRTYKKRKPAEPTTPTTKKLGRPRKPRELTEIEKDLLIIKNATNGISSDESSKSMVSEFEQKPLKRKRVSFSTDEASLVESEPSVKRCKIDENSVGD